MPITPHFVLSQTETTVIVDIRVPHVRVSVQSVEVVLDGSVLHFSSPPYLLVVNFPAPLVEESECATYDPSRDGGTITLKLRKQVAAIWEDLDMIGSLMTPRQTPGTRPANMTVVSSTSNQDELIRQDDEDGSCDNNNVSSGLPAIRHAFRPQYGFLNQHVAVFTDLAREGLAAEMLELPFPDETNSTDRRGMRLEAEQDKFDADHYVGDLYLDDDYMYQAALSMVPHWIHEQKQHGSEVDSLAQQMSHLTTNQNKDTQVGLASNCYFTSDETAQLASIPYPILPATITVEQEKSLFMGLLDLLFAYVYDHIMTQGDPTVESSWTLCTLSCTLSWLEEYSADETLETVMTNSVRRALIYPYLRNYDLALHCWRQVASIIKNGRRCVIRSLLQVRTILDKSECHYLGNRLYIDPYLIWMQRYVTDKSLGMIEMDLASVLEDVQGDKCLGKEALGLNLTRIESMAQQLEQEGAEEEYGSQSNSDCDSESSSEGDCSSDEESDTDFSSGEVGRVEGETAFDSNVMVPSSTATDNIKESLGINAGQSPSTCTKVTCHSTELLDSELPVASRTSNDILDRICDPPSTPAISHMINVTDESVAAEDATTSRPLIEEI